LGRSRAFERPAAPVKPFVRRKLDHAPRSILDTRPPSDALHQREQLRKR
jgi:hypothetical protein